MTYKILLVDDDREFRSEFKDSLYDYDVIEASSGEEALKILEKPHEIELVMLDIKMPGMSGTQALNKIRKISQDIGVIMLTAYASKDTAIEALRSKADEYLEKPMDIERTKQVIEKVLSRVRGEKELSSLDDEDKIERVKKFIERNSHKKVTLQDAAKAVCFSPKYLSRLFKENAGVGFNEYRIQAKIGRAKDILENTGYGINQVGLMLGFQNPESFMRIFKKITGLTPSEYREKKKRKTRKKPAKKPRKKKK